MIGIGLIIIANLLDNERKHPFVYEHDEMITDIGVYITMPFTIIVICMLCIIFCNHINTNAKIMKMQETYRAITYKVESGACRDELGLLNKEVIDEVQKWNETVAYGKNRQKDFWVGVFYPNIYDQFKTIDYRKYSRE